MNKLWTIIIIVTVVVVAGWVWYKWLPSQNTNQSASQNPTNTSDINQDLQNVNIDNVDSQFQSIDKDLQGL